MKKEEKKNYGVVKIDITKDEYPEIFSMFETASLLSTEIYNKALFVLRNNYTAHQKEDRDKWSENEKEIYEKVAAIEKMHDKNGNIPWVIEHMKMYHYFKENETYFKDYAGILPYSIVHAPYRLACQDFKSWHKAQQAYFKDKSKFKKRPKMPNYKQDGVPSSFSIDDMRDTLKIKNEECFLKIPNCKKLIKLTDYFKTVGKIKGIQVERKNKKAFVIRLLLEEENNYKQVIPTYYAGIDLGVNNVMTMVSNSNAKESVIFNGRQLKTINQWFNKQLAKLYHENTNGHKVEEVEVKWTKRMEQLKNKRNNQIDDQIHKIAKTAINYCLENDIGTVVIGENVGWKQEANVGKKNTQNFVQIPFEKLKSNLEYRAARHGINIIRREESYTSKADYLANDIMPKEHNKDFDKKFSGKRVSRGMYNSSIGVKINADCNGAANILRKEFPNIVIPLESLQNVRKITKFI